MPIEYETKLIREDGAMFKRKVYVALFTSILAVSALNIMEPVPFQDGGLFLGVVVYSLYIVPIVFIYGIFSSVVSDILSAKLKKYKEMTSLGFHILFGLLFILPYSNFYEYKPFVSLHFIEVVTHPIPVLCFMFSIIFFSLDRFLRNKSRQKEKNYS